MWFPRTVCLLINERLSWSKTSQLSNHNMTSDHFWVLPITTDVLSKPFPLLIAAPLNDLLKIDQKFTWTPAAETAFHQLKTALTNAYILVYPDFTKQFILSTDASHTAIGYVLGQRDDAGRERVIAYGGRALRGAEIRYGITEKQTLALVDGIRPFKVYLTHAKFLVYTDHSASKFL